MVEPEKINSISTVARFSNFTVINDELTRCRCRVLYTGRDRNYFDIPESALNKLIERKGYANIPVVAHLMKDADGNYHVGGHDYKITYDSNGQLEYEDETVPFGVIPEDCNPGFEDVTEKSGRVRKYFCVDIVLWSHRYPIMKAAYSDEIYFNQSMEIDINEYHYDGDYIVTDDFSLSALCLLNKSNGDDNVEPCFESAAVIKFNFEDENIKRGFSELRHLYEQTKKGGESGGMEGIKNVLAKETYINVLGESTQRYEFISDEGDNKFCYFDRQSSKAYIASYNVGADGTVTIDFAAAKECLLKADSSGKNGIDLSGEFSRVAKDAGEAQKKITSEGIAQKLVEYEEKFNSLRTENETLKAQFSEAATELARRDSVDAQKQKEQHEKQIKELINSYSAKFDCSRFVKAEFELYSADPKNLAKTAEQVDNDLTFMVGKAQKDAMDRYSSGSRSTVDWALFSNASKHKTAQSERYGDLFDRVMCDD